MKASLLLTAFILAAGGMAGWALRAKTNEAHETLRSVERTAGETRAARDLAGKEPTEGNHNRSQLAYSSDPAFLSKELLAFAKTLDNSPNPQDKAAADARRMEMLDWQRRLTGLEPERMLELIAEIQSADDLSKENRQGLLRLMLQALSEQHPLEALQIFSQQPNLLEGRSWNTASLVADAMVRGMGQDPEATIRWFKENRESFPERVRDSMTERLLRGTGQSNPEAAFRLIKGLEIQNSEYAVSMITNPARDNGSRTNTLTAFRNYLQTVEDPAKQAELRFDGNYSLIMNALNQGFEPGLDWISKAGFSDKELEAYVRRVRRNLSSSETPQWLDWVGHHIKDQKVVAQTYRDQIQDWAQLDYHAAGEWLEKAPEGPAKVAAAEGYAAVLAPYYPEKAARWVETLPDGQERTAIMHQVVAKWRTTDAAAADAFAEKHGIQR